jgi:hypothetical protein
MKKKMTLAFAASMLTLALGASPQHASAAVMNYLWFPTAASHASVSSTVVAYAVSLLL